MNPQSKARRIATWILTSLITLIFVFSAVMKFLGSPQVVEVFEGWGLRNQMTMIALGEIISAILFFLPRTNSLGVLLLSAYMGGHRDAYAKR